MITIAATSLRTVKPSACVVSGTGWPPIVVPPAHVSLTSTGTGCAGMRICRPSRITRGSWLASTFHPTGRGLVH